VILGYTTCVLPILIFHILGYEKWHLTSPEEMINIYAILY